jgi:hypothetical protein
MTVAELTAKLSELEQNAEIYIYDEDHGICMIQMEKTAINMTSQEWILDMMPTATMIDNMEKSGSKLIYLLK